MMTASERFIRTIVDGDAAQVRSQLRSAPALATQVCRRGATRQHPEHFFRQIAHYMYEGDTPLHMAAAAFQRDIALWLIRCGADVRARNRRGAEPLHYAADANHWNPAAQAATIAGLLAAGADANALDKSGVAPLHRAVRTRCAAAVKALLDGGADPTLTNGHGSTPLDLASRTTGRGGSGTLRAREQQLAIRRLLEQRLTADVG